MRIASFNVNSARTRSDRMLALLKRHDIDVLAVQETKCKDEQFPRQMFEDAGYEVAHVGLNQWNGVALLSRVGLDNIFTHFPGQPGFAKDQSKPQLQEARAVGATCGGVEVWSLYVPNGRALTDPHYNYKLQFLHNLGRFVEHRLAADPDLPLVLCGDYNIAPRDEDVWDMEFFKGKTHVTEPERAAFESLCDAGLTDVARPYTEGEYTYFDYTQLRFPRGEGMRIDFQLASPSLAKTVSAAQFDREERKVDKSGQLSGPSDHLPVIVDYDVA